jgi:hypothetical protein
LGERGLCKPEAGGSIPPTSTTPRLKPEPALQVLALPGAGAEPPGFIAATCLTAGRPRALTAALLPATGDREERPLQRMPFYPRINLPTGTVEVGVADVIHIELLEQGVRAWNQWRRGDLSLRPDLSGADLRGKELVYANFTGSDLSGADLSGTKMKQVYLTHANLSGAKMKGAELLRVDFRAANLSETDMEDALLHEAIFARTVLYRTVLRGADLRDSIWINAFLQEVDLTGADMTGADLTGATLNEVKAGGAIGLDPRVIDRE